MLAVIVVGLTAFALLAARFVESDGNLWPRDDLLAENAAVARGVQEDDSIAWHVPRRRHRETAGQPVRYRLGDRSRPRPRSVGSLAADE